MMVGLCIIYYSCRVTEQKNHTELKNFNPLPNLIEFLLLCDRQLTFYGVVFCIMSVQVSNEYIVWYASLVVLCMISACQPKFSMFWKVGRFYEALAI